jgi:sigma-B regulation protein RsbU (phosphoserine phosphatase)
MEGCGTELAAPIDGPDRPQATATLLIVDDAAVNRELLRLKLRTHGYQFIPASNGWEAVQAMQENSGIDLILLDLVMPQMDGFDFLTWRAKTPFAMEVPVIVNSSLDDFDSIAKALDMGAYDYFTKPLSREILDIVLPLKIKNAVMNRRLMLETKRKNDIMRQELEMAARYQKFLLPSNANLDSVKVAFKFQPCSAVGGDYFDFMELPHGMTACVVADVSGHGVASAMTASICKALLPRYLRQCLSPAKALAALNHDLIKLTQEDVFVTVCATMFDPKNRRLIWASAGHPPPVFISQNQGCSRLAYDSIFLGMFDNDNPLVEFEDMHQPVKKGDRLALFTDGLIEAPDKAHSLFGLERLENLLIKGRSQGIHDLAGSVWQGLQGFAGMDFPDDVAFILMEF